MRRFGYCFILLAIAITTNGFVSSLPRLHHGHHADQSPFSIKKTMRSGQVAESSDELLRSILDTDSKQSDPVKFPLIRYEVKKAQINGPELASKLNDLTFSRIFISRKDFV